MIPSWLDGFLSARLYDLEQPRTSSMPIHPSHKPGYHYALHRRHKDTYHPDLHGPRSSASGMLTMMEHTGTHIDAPSHQADCLRLCGGVPAADVETPSGFTQQGIETVPPLLRRGVLLDVAGSKRVAVLPSRYGITAEDMTTCAVTQGVEVRPGDVLLVRTGFAAKWREEEAYLDAAGVSKSGSLWAAERGVVAVGADNMAWDVPGERDPESGATLFAHWYLLAQRGIYIIENLMLDELARDQRWEFAFVGLPLKFVGATGSPLRPVALV